MLKPKDDSAVIIYKVHGGYVVTLQSYNDEDGELGKMITTHAMTELESVEALVKRHLTFLDSNEVEKKLDWQHK